MHGRSSAPSTSRSRLGRPRKPKLCALEVLLIGSNNDLAQDQLEVELSIGYLQLIDYLFLDL